MTRRFLFVRRKRRLRDRYTGLGISVPLCASVFLLMAMIHVSARTLEPAGMEILLRLTDEAPPAEPRKIEETEKTTAQEQQDAPETEEVPQPGEEVPEQPLPPEPAEELSDADLGNEESKPVTFNDWIPNSKEAADLQAIRGGVDDHGRKLDQKRQTLKENIVRAQVSSAARDFKYNTDGGMFGAIRTFAFEGFETDDVRPVLERYGFTFERKHVKPQAGRNILNAAITSEGIYTTRPDYEEGMYEVLSLSAKATAFLATREVDALQARGFDPKNSRVRKIIFGIVKRENGELDLDVVDLEVERVR